MKAYEHVSQIELTPRMPMIVRIDGRAFHTYTRGFDKPWSDPIREALTAAADALLSEISGSKIAYCQSDEISVLVTDYDKLDSQPWFGKSVQKICSVTASIATVAFNDAMARCRTTWEGGARYTTEIPGSRRAQFDSRCFTIPREDVGNYFLWRQRDATRNSVAALGQAHFSSRQLHGKSGPQIQDMLHEIGINWNDCDTWKKRGWCVRREPREIEPGRVRPVIVLDMEIPIFSGQIPYFDPYINADLEHGRDQDQTNDAPTTDPT